MADRKEGQGRKQELLGSLAKHSGLGRDNPATYLLSAHSKATTRVMHSPSRGTYREFGTGEVGMGGSPQIPQKHSQEKQLSSSENAVNVPSQRYTLSKLSQNCAASCSFASHNATVLEGEEEEYQVGGCGCPQDLK